MPGFDWQHDHCCHFQEKEHGQVKIDYLCNVLVSPSIKWSTFHVFLTILAWADLGYLLVCVLDESLRLNVVALTDPHVPPRLSWVYIYPKFLFPLQQIFMSCSIYMTVVICINRYGHVWGVEHKLVICVPSLVRYMCIVYPLKFTPHCPPCESYKAVDSRRITISTSCVVIGSILYSIPHFMEYQVSWEDIGTIGTPFTVFV